MAFPYSRINCMPSRPMTWLDAIRIVVVCALYGIRIQRIG